MKVDIDYRQIWLAKLKETEPEVYDIYIALNKHEKHTSGYYIAEFIRNEIPAFDTPQKWWKKKLGPAPVGWPSLEYEKSDAAVERRPRGVVHYLLSLMRNMKGSNRG